MGRVLQGSLLRLKVNVNQTESLLVSLLPLAVVHDGPVKVAADIRAVGDRATEREQVAMGVVDPLRIMDLSIQADPIDPRHAVFRDDEGDLVSLVEKPRAPI